MKFAIDDGDLILAWYEDNTVLPDDAHPGLTIVSGSEADIEYRDEILPDGNSFKEPHKFLGNKTRSITRGALRTQWDSLPSYIRGPYRPLFESVNVLLDLNTPDAQEDAVEMILAAEPTAKIAADPTMSATFSATKTAFKTSIENL